MSKLAHPLQSQEPFPSVAKDSAAAQRHYRVFISYSHDDTTWASWLMRRLEAYTVPVRFHGQTAPIGTVGPRLAPVFRDRDELPTTSALGETIRTALRESATMVVICSPASAKSRWVQEEIIAFKRLHGEARVFALIVNGEPKIEGAADDCFSPALRRELGADGRLAAEPAEHVAADARRHADGREVAFIRLVAGLLGVGFDQLYQRELHRRHRRMTLIAAASVLGMAITLGLAALAWQARDEAQQQRSKAENLLEFMIGDLRKKLDPVGRLDVLDSVGEKVLAYYARQTAGQLDANALGRRSRALHLIGEIREQRGQLDTAQVAFQQAADTTAQLLALAPRDGQRIFEHAQSVYWVGYLAWKHGQLPEAERAFRNYLSLATRLRTIDASNSGWQAEAAYAHENIGVVCLESARGAEALAAFSQTRAIWHLLLPKEPMRALELANTISWIAKTYEAQGNFARALEAQKEEQHVLESVPDAASNQQVGRILLLIQAELARLELALGRAAAARDSALTAVEIANRLVTVDPQNKIWLEQLHQTEAILAETQLATNDRVAARENAQRTLAGSLRLVALDPTMADWQVNLRGRALFVATLLATDDERPRRLADLKDYLVKVRQFTTADRSLGQTRDAIVAKNELLFGDLLARDGQRAEAVIHWRAVTALLQAMVAQGNLDALTTFAAAQFRLGAVAEARQLAQQIEATTYRHPAYADLVRLLTDEAGSSVAPPPR